MIPKDSAAEDGFPRIQSPSSINTFRQCPRKYFYQYVEKRQTGTNIHLIRGSVVHSVLEEFFAIDISKISVSGLDLELKIILHELLSRKWKEASDKLDLLDMASAEKERYFSESRDMLQMWLLGFLRDIKAEMGKGTGLVEAFLKLAPKTEVHYVSAKFGVQGYIDAIHESCDGICLLDYKTSSRNKISQDYYLQLGIYAILYHEKHGSLPCEVGIHFLKFEDGLQKIAVDDSMIAFAVCECQRVHQNTVSADIEDYPRKQSSLCRWSTGQCDFFDICSKNS